MANNYYGDKNTLYRVIWNEKSKSLTLYSCVEGRVSKVVTMIFGVKESKMALKEFEKYTNVGFSESAVDRFYGRPSWR